MLPTRRNGCKELMVEEFSTSRLGHGRGVCLAHPSVAEWQGNQDRHSECSPARTANAWSRAPADVVIPEIREATLLRCLFAEEDWRPAGADTRRRRGRPGR